MTGGERDGEIRSLEEVAELEDASKKRIIEEGGPKAADGETSGEDQPTGIVSEDEETGLIDPLKGK